LNALHWPSIWRTSDAYDGPHTDSEYDFGSEDKAGNQDSAISVFTRDSDGTVRHFYTGHPWLAHDIKQRGIDELNPIWNLMDLTRQGRGEFFAKLEYPETA
jgi:predicted dithiol-disulfide oxidoreductase (DUF899 family)